MSTNTRNRVQEAVREHFESFPDSPQLRRAPPGYTLTPTDNLLPGIPETVLEDFASGSGDELGGEAPKFCAVHSSSALAANSFGLMRLHPARFALAGLSGFTEARFEQKLPAGLRGTPPNLDFFATGPNGTVAVESKFTEILTPHDAEFANVYDGAVDRLAQECWKAVYRSLRANPKRFRRLNAAQLVKHYLGIQYSLKNTPGNKVLLYVFWEPSNAADVAEFSEHRAELATFSEEVADSEIRFVRMTYSEMWKEWESAGNTSPRLASHLKALRARYELAV